MIKKKYKKSIILKICSSIDIFYRPSKTIRYGNSKHLMPSNVPCHVSLKPLAAYTRCFFYFFIQYFIQYSTCFLLHF